MLADTQEAPMSNKMPVFGREAAVRGVATVQARPRRFRFHREGSHAHHYTTNAAGSTGTRQMPLPSGSTQSSGASRGVDKDGKETHGAVC